MSLRDDAVAIWNAGVAAVDSSQAVQRHVRIDDNCLVLADVRIPLTSTRKIEVVGAGKAGAGMAIGIEAALLAGGLADHVSGWVNVPANCVRPLKRIHLHAARPAGLNEPTADSVRGTQEILRRVQSLGKSDICIVLLSGGASALLCCPASGISLDDKLAVSRALASCGAPIQELNLVRTQLSQVKGGQLAAACRAETLVALIISDVIGDPLDVIGSGPTTPVASTAADALQILQKYELLRRIPTQVISYLQRRAESPPASNLAMPLHTANCIVASNRIAVAAAATEAESLGYAVKSLGSANDGDAADEGRHLLNQLLAVQSQMNSAAPDGAPNQGRRVCVLSGGEPTVTLTSPADGREQRTAPGFAAPRGGRNQELVLAAIATRQQPDLWHNLALLSGGTDGEDGPTDAAGAIADEALLIRIAASGLDPGDFLNRHDSYSFFEATDGLFQTGPTHTNVMDLRVGLVESRPAREL